MQAAWAVAAIVDVYPPDLHRVIRRDRHLHRRIYPVVFTVEHSHMRKEHDLHIVGVPGNRLETRRPQLAAIIFPFFRGRRGWLIEILDINPRSPWVKHTVGLPTG